MKSGAKYLGEKASVESCAEACRKEAGCTVFLFGIDEQANKCWFERLDDPDPGLINFHGCGSGGFTTSAHNAYMLISPSNGFTCTGKILQDTTCQEVGYRNGASTMLLSRALEPHGFATADKRFSIACDSNAYQERIKFHSHNDCTKAVSLLTSIAGSSISTFSCKDYYGSLSMLEAKTSADCEGAAADLNEVVRVYAATPDAVRHTPLMPGKRTQHCRKITSRKTFIAL